MTFCYSVINKLFTIEQDSINSKVIKNFLNKKKRAIDYFQPKIKNYSDKSFIFHFKSYFHLNYSYFYSKISKTIYPTFSSFVSTLCSNLTINEKKLLLNKDKIILISYNNLIILEKLVENIYPLTKKEFVYKTIINKIINEIKYIKFNYLGVLMNYNKLYNLKTYKFKKKQKLVIKVNTIKEKKKFGFSIKYSYTKLKIKSILKFFKIKRFDIVLDNINTNKENEISTAFNFNRSIYDNSNTMNTKSEYQKKYDTSEEKYSNPLKLPIGWDGNPIPFWLYKLHGLNEVFKCEVCGNARYYGRKAYEKHFYQKKHTSSLISLGIKYTDQFRHLTSINKVLELARNLSTIGIVKETEDEQGNITRFIIK